MNSEDFLASRQKNLFKVAVYYQAEQNVVTRITKAARMSVSDKLSWIGGMCGLFTGFSVISGFEILYWLIFKILFHKKGSKVDIEEVKVCNGEDNHSEKRSHVAEERASMAFDAIFQSKAK